MPDNGLQVLERPAIASGDVGESAALMQQVSQVPYSEWLDLELPQMFDLGTLGDGRFRLLRPLGVVVTRETDDFIANATEVDEFGYGATRAEAVRDLQRTIVALYLSLEADEARLGPDLVRILNELRSKARRVR